MSEIIVVTGLPRSGTSLMMQLLESAGIPILTDGLRKSDISNPEGYYEYEPVKGIVKDNSFLKGAEGKAVKIVAPLPMFMDSTLSYRVIFMRREIDEVLRSQEKMLNKDQSAEREKFRMIFEGHLSKTYAFLEKHSIPSLDVHFKELVQNPEKVLKEWKEFLSLNTEMDVLMNVVKPDLYRNR
jgi:hypothetical protein